MKIPNDISRQERLIGQMVAAYVARNSISDEQCIVAGISIADKLIARLDAEAKAPVAEAKVEVAYPIIVARPDDGVGWVYRSNGDGDAWQYGKCVGKVQVTCDLVAKDRRTRTPAQVGGWYEANYFPNGVRKVFPVVLVGTWTSLVYRSEVNGDVVDDKRGYIHSAMGGATENFSGDWKILTPAESAKFLSDHGYDAKGNRKEAPPAPKPEAVPAKGEGEKCVHCGKVMGGHLGLGRWCAERETGDNRSFTPPQPTEKARANQHRYRLLVDDKIIINNGTLELLQEAVANIAAVQA